MHSIVFKKIYAQQCNTSVRILLRSLLTNTHNVTIKQDIPCQWSHYLSYRKTSAGEKISMSYFIHVTFFFFIDFLLQFFMLEWNWNNIESSVFVICVSTYKLTLVGTSWNSSEGNRARWEIEDGVLVKPDSLKERCNILQLSDLHQSKYVRKTYSKM